LACHLQIDADPDPTYHFDADGDADPDPAYPVDPDPEADPDPTFHFDAYSCGSGSTTLASPEVLFSLKKVIIFRARKGLITDIWTGSLERHSVFVIVYVKREFPYTVLSELSWKDLLSPVWEGASPLGCS
jgi:hypothetical protein